MSEDNQPLGPGTCRLPCSHDITGVRGREGDTHLGINYPLGWRLTKLDSLVRFAQGSRNGISASWAEKQKQRFPLLICGHLKTRELHKMNKLISGAAIAVAAIALGVSGAQAQAAPANPAQDNLQVTANVIKACRVTGDTLNFGNVNGILQQDNVSNSPANIVVICTPGTTYGVALGMGGAGSTATQRLLKSAAGETHPYNITTDSAGKVLWADLTTESGTGHNVTYPVYGVMPKSDAPITPGTYTDTVVISVSY